MNLWFKNTEVILKVRSLNNIDNNLYNFRVMPFGLIITTAPHKQFPVRSVEKMYEEIINDD
ncbi:hypothetical protein DERP_003577 [Dermatophagoides pteronyssinus]|uniref:Uncharacterized protein n=1 Tax=Dermatophagoides pteronyssinus TaxID=6956 RepID=A0ABQ8JL54_DERPT|nr:hypothetical protein DERP_003577 [Dermatophagoides pteronyssinus]